MASETPTKARLVHQVPGRMRLRFEKTVDVQEAAHRLQSALSGMPEFTTLEAHPASHSVIIRYNPLEIEVERLLQEGFTAAFVDILEEGTQALARIASKTALGTGVVKAVNMANAGVERATGGILGLRDALPLSLVGLGIERLLRGPKVTVPWYNLLYFGYASFADLHARHVPQVPVEPDAQETISRRYARGELSRDEFRQMMAELAAPGSPEQSGGPSSGEQQSSTRPKQSDQTHEGQQAQERE